MKKRVLHISKYYYPFVGGTEQTARDIVYALKDGYDQKVVAFSEKFDTQKIVIDGVEVIKCGCFARISSQSLSLSYRKILQREINDYKPDIVIFHYPNPFVASILLKNIKPDMKLVLYWHLDIIRQKFLRIFFKGQNGRLLKRADKVICTSPNYIKGSEWLRTVQPKCVVIPSCINEKRMQVTPEIEQCAAAIRKENAGKIIGVAVGRHTEYKGFQYLIHASGRLDDSFRFYITGQGELTQTLHKEAAADKKITFTGKVEDDELKALILASDIFCFPSVTKNEAFGLALAEGMYYGKPAVTFHIPGSGVNYVCLDGVTGIEVENGNVKKYAEALKKLAGDKELREKYGKAGRKRVKENFLSEQFYENIKSVVASL